MRRTLWPLAALGMVVMVAVVGAGCGGTSTAAPAGNTGTASSNGTGSTNTASPHAKAVKFAECMRANGVSAFPDPDATGALTIDAVANCSSVDTSSATFKQAVSSCKDLEPSGFTGHQRSAQEQKAALAFAQCIRDNGVRDFPDPTPDGPLIDTNRIPSVAGKDPRSVLDAPMQKCRDFAAGAGVRGQ